MSEYPSGLQMSTQVSSSPAAASGRCKNIDTKRRELTARQGSVDVQKGEDTQIWNAWVGLSRTQETGRKWRTGNQVVRAEGMTLMRTYLLRQKQMDPTLKSRCQVFRWLFSPGHSNMGIFLGRELPG